MLTWSVFLTRNFLPQKANNISDCETAILRFSQSAICFEPSPIFFYFQMLLSRTPCHWLYLEVTKQYRLLKNCAAIQCAERKRWPLMSGDATFRCFEKNNCDGLFAVLGPLEVLLSSLFIFWNITEHKKDNKKILTFLGNDRICFKRMLTVLVSTTLSWEHVLILTL